MESPSEHPLGPWEVAGYQVSIDVSDRARLVAARGDARLKALPAAVRHGDDMAWLRLSLEAVRGHQRALRTLLETALVEQVPLSGEDLAFLALDPVGRSLLERVLLDTGSVVGRPLPDEWLCETVDGRLCPLETPARVVHPLALRRADTLPRWNAWLNRQPFRQPFRQVRREIYSPSEEERPGASSSRFAGDGVRWDRARALLEGRGWYRVTKTLAERRFRRARLTAFLEFRSPSGRGWGRYDVELGRVYFLPTGEQAVNRARPGVPLGQVPAIVYSESLRDAALVAGVAGRHREE